MTFPRHRRSGSTRLIAGAIVVFALAAIAACEPTAPPGFTATPAPSAGAGATASAPGASAPQGSAPVAGEPEVTLDGAIVRIVGLGNGRSPDFELPAGSAGMTISVCDSNQVIPFVTLYDGDDNKLGIIVEPTYAIKDLAGGTYYVDVATNPNCVWTIEITPS